MVKAKRIKVFAINVALLTATTIIIRSIAVAFNVYISSKLGSEGMGLFTLVMSVYGFALTFAVSGVGLAATRLTADSMGMDSDIAVRCGMRRCLLYGLAFGICSALILFASSAPVGIHLLGDERTVISLRMLSVSLPFVSLSVAVQGYFNGVRRAAKGASSQILTLIIRMCITAWIFSLMLPDGLEYACFAVAVGSTVSELINFIYISVLYLWDLKKYNKNAGAKDDKLTKKLFSIAVPVALSAYVRSGLLTVEHLLIPYGLRKSGIGGEKAIATYGVLCGMVLPVVLFPMAFLTAFANMLVPELAEAKVRGASVRINYIISRVFQITLLFSIGSAGFMMCFANEIGMTIYNNAEAAEYIRIMAPLIPVMYLDHATDGILKGLGEQLYCMRVNIADSLISCILVWLLLPYYGVKGYVAIIFVCEVLNTALSISRLLVISEVRTQIFKWLVLPLICIIGSASLVKLIFSSGYIIISSPVISFTLYIVVSVVLYIIFLRLTQSLSGDDVKWVKSIIKS